MRRFDALWVPRVGADAAAIMRRVALWRAMGLPFVILVVILSVVTNGGVAYYAIAIPVLIVICTGYLVAQRRSREPLAAALTHHLGLPISPKQLPPLATPQVFDRAIANMRAGKPMYARQRSFFGGFIRIGTP